MKVESIKRASYYDVKTMRLTDESQGAAEGMAEEYFEHVNKCPIKEAVRCLTEYGYI